MKKFEMNSCATWLWNEQHHQSCIVLNKLQVICQTCIFNGQTNLAFFLNLLFKCPLQPPFLPLTFNFTIQCPYLDMTILLPQHMTNLLHQHMTNLLIRMEVASSQPDYLPTLSAAKTYKLSQLVKHQILAIDEASKQQQPTSSFSTWSTSSHSKWPSSSHNTWPYKRSLYTIANWYSVSF